MFVLAVDVDQPSAELLQRLQRQAGAVDEAARTSLGGEEPPRDAFAAGVQALFFQPRLQVRQRGDVETRAHVGALAAVAHHATVGAVAEREAERVDQYRFAGAGLAGECGHAAAKIEFELGDDGEVADVQVRLHGVSVWRVGATPRIHPWSPSAAWHAGCGNSRGWPGGSAGLAALSCAPGCGRR